MLALKKNAKTLTDTYHTIGVENEGLHLANGKMWLIAAIASGRRELA